MLWSRRHKRQLTPLTSADRALPRSGPNGGLRPGVVRPAAVESARSRGIEGAARPRVGVRSGAGGRGVFRGKPRCARRSGDVPVLCFTDGRRRSGVRARPADAARRPWPGVSRRGASRRVFWPASLSPQPDARADGLCVHSGLSEQLSAARDAARRHLKQEHHGQRSTRRPQGRRSRRFHGGGVRRAPVRAPAGAWAASSRRGARSRPLSD